MLPQTFNSESIVLKRRRAFRKNKHASATPPGPVVGGVREFYADSLDPGFEDMGGVKDFEVAPGVLGHFSRNEGMGGDYASMHQLERKA